MLKYAETMSSQLIAAWPVRYLSALRDWGIPVLLARRVVALVAALFGFYIFVTNQNVFASFGAMLLGGCALMIAFPSIAHWLAGEAMAAERDRTLRSDIVTFAVTAAICVAFFVLAPRQAPHQCGGPIDSLFQHCIPTSESAALAR